MTNRFFALLLLHQIYQQIQITKTMADNTSKIKKSVEIDANLAPVLDFMLKKAKLQLSDLNDTFIRLWINQNMDLLTEAEKRKFKI
jgi:hypothetical protein